MAEFTIRPEAERPGSYVGLSQGIYADRNNALGELFSDVAEVGGQAVQVADQAVQEDIEQDIFNEVDLIQQEFGVASATNLEEDVTSEQANVPGFVQDSARHLQGLQSAYESGTLNQAHYWARLNSMVRQLRGRYPGYRNEIDTMVSGVVGTTPANALQSALFQQWNQSSDEDTSYQDLVERISSDMGLPADFEVRASNGDPYTYSQLLSFQSNKNRQQWETSARRSAMAEEADAGNLTEAQVQRNFRIDATQFTNTLINDASTSIGSGFQSVREQIQQAQQAISRGEPWDQETVTQINGQIEELYTAAQLRLREEYFGSWTAGKGGDHSYSEFLSTEQRENIINDALAPINILRDAMSSGEGLPIAGAMTAYTEAYNTQSGYEILRDVPFVRQLSALTELVGIDVAGVYMSKNTDLMDAATQAMLDVAHSGAGLGQGSIGDSMRTGVESGLGGEYQQGLVDRWTNTVDAWSTGEVSLELLQNNVSYMFSDDSTAVLSQLDTESQYEYFRRVISPEITNKMVQLKDSGDVESWNQYQEWATTAFISLFRQEIQTIQNYNIAPSVLGAAPEDNLVIWDEASKGFKFRSAGFYGIGAGVGETDTLRKLNTAIRGISPILEENGGQTSLEIYRLLEGMGYNPDAPRGESMENRMIGFIFDALATTVSSTGGPTDG